MTREEAIEFIAQSVKSDVDMALVAEAIKALEQQPCEDCISRESVMLRVREFIGNPTYTEKMLYCTISDTNIGNIAIRQYTIASERGFSK